MKGRDLLQMAFLWMAFIAGGKAFTQSYATLDPRIQHDFTEAEYNHIVSTYPDSAAKLIFYYTASYVIVNPDCNDCYQLQMTEVDITKYEHLRLPHTRMRVGMNRHRDMIEMLSQDELRAQYEWIENQP